MIDPPKAVTEDARYRAVQEARERDAATAQREHTAYLRMTRVLIVATALAAVAGGLVLYGLEAKEAASGLVHYLSTDAVRYSLVAFQAFCMSAAGFCGYVLVEHDPKARWIGSRLRAEDGRLVRARRILELGHAIGQETFEGAGEWFVAFIDDQLAHLRDSADKRESAAYSLAVLGGVLAALIALAGALAGIRTEAVVVAIALLGVIAPALTSAVRGWREATAYKRRAALHDDTWVRLNDLRGEISHFEAAVGAGDLAGALAFAEKVFDVLRRDHSGFASIHESGEARPAADGGRTGP